MARAQVTLFIVLAVLLVLGLLVARVNLVEPEQVLIAQSFDSRVLAVKQHVQSCVDQTVDDAMLLFGSRGGLLYPPLVDGAMVKVADTDVAIWQFGGVNTVPSQEFIEQYQLAEYVRLQLPKCIDLKPFADLNIAAGSLNVSVALRERDVSFVVDYPLVIKQDSAEAMVREFISRRDVPLKSLIAEGSRLINHAKAVPGLVDLSALEESSYQVSVSRLNDTVVVYAIQDVNTAINGVPFTLTFAAVS